MKKIIKRIKRRHIKQLVTYGVIGVIALSVQMAVYLSLCHLHLTPVYANLIGAAIGMILAYKGHVKYTFNRQHKFSRDEFIKYVATSIFGIIFNSAGVYLLVNMLRYHSDFGVIPMIMTPGITFIINKLWSFR